MNQWSLMLVTLAVRLVGCNRADTAPTEVQHGLRAPLADRSGSDSVRTDQPKRATQAAGDAVNAYVQRALLLAQSGNKAEAPGPWSTPNPSAGEATRLPRLSPSTLAWKECRWKKQRRSVRPNQSCPSGKRV